MNSRQRLHYRLQPYSSRSLQMFLLVLATAFLFTVSAASAREEVQSGPGLDQAVALESFDQVWDQVRAQYFDFQRIEGDWQAAREQLRPKAAEAQDLASLRAVLQDLLELIGESHFAVIPSDAYEQLADLSESPASDSPDAPPGAPRSATGLSVRVVDNVVRVTEVQPDSPAEAAGIAPGWSLVQVDQVEMASVLEELESIMDPVDRRRSMTLLEYGLLGRVTHTRPEREILLRLLDTDDQLHEVSLLGSATSHGAVQIGNLPPMTFDFGLEQLDTEAGCISLVRFSSWVPALPEEFRAHRDEIFACPGLILDVRGNPGGVLPTMVTLAADLFQETALLGTLMRSDGHIDFRVMPRRVAMDGTRLTPFPGPIAILIDRMSGSTSEMFAAGMQATGRARLFGERSAGMALPAQVMPLASGDVLMYAFADYRDSLERRIEGLGAIPDTPVDLSADVLTQRPSPVIQAALDWLANEIH
ncbi:MAG: hypothetical protein JJU31_01420 [Wenzhouxiangella sp.]|nr:hypothetical protein [Wenzhouxiangella sp.]MCH8478408.1 hypothetical protein [Wenzhouxiangella sp.]